MSSLMGEFSGHPNYSTHPIEISSTQLYLNEQPVTITAEASVIRNVNEDDAYLVEYVKKAAKGGQFDFLFKDQPQLKRIVVRRASPSKPPFPPLKPVWYRKGRPSDVDQAAVSLLLKLRGSEKYVLRFKDSHSSLDSIWEEVAGEMRAEGYDVDGPMCSQKFLSLAHKHRQADEPCCCCDQRAFPPDFCRELGRMWGGKGDEDEWLPGRAGKRKREEEEENELLKKILKRNGEQKEEYFKEIASLFKERNTVMKERVRQNDRIITLLEQLVNKY